MVCDTFASETVAFADLVLPDTSYLERHDVMSMLDRPISEYDGPVDSVRIPVLPPKGECKPFQDVLVELGSRLKLPAFTNADGSRKYPRLSGSHRQLRDLARFRHRLPGRLARQGRRKVHQGRTQSEASGRCTRRTTASSTTNCRAVYQYMRNWNKGYLRLGARHGMIRYAEPINIHIYSEVLQKFRLAAQGKWPGKQPPERLRKRVETYFDPLPFYYDPLETQATDLRRYPLMRSRSGPWRCITVGLAECLAAPDPQLTTICSSIPASARRSGIEDGDWMWVESMHGKVRCLCRYSEAVEPGTVWTWNAIGKAAGAWGLAAKPTSRARASCSTT